MSGASTQGVGAASCANTGVVIAAAIRIAAAIESVLVGKGTRVGRSCGVVKSVCVENLVMMHAPGDGYGYLVILEQTTNVIRPSIQCVGLPPASFTVTL
jgi:hypothetical protein